MHQNTNLPSAYQRMEHVFLYCSEYACTYIHVCTIGVYIQYDMIVCVFPFFPPTLFERLLFWM